MFDLGIYADYAILYKNEKLVVEKSVFMGVTAGKIAAIEIAPDVSALKTKCKEFVSTKSKLLMPGLVNGHTHVPMSLFRGFSDDEPFTDWLFKTIVPLEGKLVDEKFVKLGTELSALECIRFGTTTISDMYYFANKVAQVWDQAGLRGILCEPFVDFPVPDSKNDPSLPEKILMENIEKYKSHSRIHPGVGPHAPYTCGDETLKKAAAYSEKYGIPIHIHVSETAHEVKDHIEKHGMSPVARLDKLGCLKCNTIMAHCVHLSDEDIALIQKSGASAIYNPESNMKLGSGIARIPEMLKAGLKVGMGTDGAASNNNLNLFEEMDVAAKLQKVKHGDTTALTAEAVLKLATIDGARALGLEKETGSLEVGKSADFLLVDMDHPHFQPLSNIISHVAYSATGLEVSSVYVEGKKLFGNGQYTTLDKDRIFKEVEQMRGVLTQTLASL